MKLDTIDAVKKYIIKAGISDKSQKPVIEVLNGGVSCTVWKIVLKDNRWVMKQALEKLKVNADWFSDIERIHREHEVMDVLYDLVPKGAISKVLHVDYINHIYMMACAEEEVKTWKDILMNGNFNVSYAKNAAALLRKIHECSNSINDEDKAKFQDQKYFIQVVGDACTHYQSHEHLRRRKISNSFHPISLFL